MRGRNLKNPQVGENYLLVSKITRHTTHKYKFGKHLSQSETLLLLEGLKVGFMVELDDPLFQNIKPTTDLAIFRVFRMIIIRGEDLKRRKCELQIESGWTIEAAFQSSDPRQEPQESNRE